MDTFGAWVRGLREGEGLTQIDLAQKMDVDQTVISRIEMGKQEPTERFCVAFARAMSMPVDSVLRRAGFIDERGVDAPREDEAVEEFRWRLARVTDRGAREMALATVWSVLDTAAKQRPKQGAR